MAANEAHKMNIHNMEVEITTATETTARSKRTAYQATTASNGSKQQQ
jgi:hypothetical protein